MGVSCHLPLFDEVDTRASLDWTAVIRVPISHLSICQPCGTISCATAARREVAATLGGSFIVLRPEVESRAIALGLHHQTRLRMKTQHAGCLGCLGG